MSNEVKWQGNEPPYCNFCFSYTYAKPILATYDGKTKDGPWALMCDDHFKKEGIGLGTGRGQKLIYDIKDLIMDDPEGILLHCLGCGNPVIRVQPGDTTAISCACGATGPILYDPSGGDMRIPHSLIIAFGEETIDAHWEYYLGYSNHVSDRKTETRERLKEMGATSQQDCDEEECLREFTRLTQRWNDLQKPRMVFKASFIDSDEILDIGPLRKGDAETIAWHYAESKGLKVKSVYDEKEL